MLEKLKISLTILITNLILANKVLAEDYGGVDPEDAGSLGETIVELVRKVGMPLGGGFLFFSVVVIAIMLMVTSGNARKRTAVMEGFLYVGIGGIVLGSALFISGVLLGIGESLGR